MRLELQFDHGDPPTGHVSALDGAPVSFAGWLELLRVLADLTAAPATDDAAGGGGQPAAGPLPA